MKLYLFLIFLIAANAAIPETAEYENPLHFFFYGLWYVATGFVKDLITWNRKIPIDAKKTIAEIIMTAGYQFETHKIITQDRYINTAWRITGKLDESLEDPHPEERPCVILQHGLLDNSATWMIPERSVALPFRLAELGYDVWMTNSRGNINSFEHLDSETHSIFDTSSDYYKFSYDDMARYDVPANLDYVLKHSNFDKAFYVGHSQGTTQFFAAAGIHEDLKDKISGFIGLAPVMHIGNIYDPFLTLLNASHLDSLLRWLKQYNFLIIPQFISPIIRFATVRFRNTFWRVLSLFFGIDKHISVDLDRMPVVANHEPGGTSLWNMIHWKQSFVSGEFKAMDWGKQENMIRYGQETPPFYKHEDIKETFDHFPSLLIAGANDALVPPKDLVTLQSVLSPTGTEVIVIDDYAHGDLIWAKDIKQTTFDPLVEFITKHTPPTESS
uniref:AB hydrolase-1 domain-containing protein n=1 Tax=Euplotes crassus TaxID=5936 RepID=A0A7S3KSP4_EUPCR|mmetsp:Transcript_38905/g.38493  ORF Transcript_38905/g.38493 Transcript_38905/m.38493 type:complete len:442 (+) Transcript_38905:13-1338(+)